MSVFAVVPVKDLLGTKSRLSPILDPASRAGLTLYTMSRVLSALREAGVENACVVSPDRLVLEKVRETGATPLLQESRGLNPALEEGRRWATDQGASSLLVLPADLPLLGAPDVRALLQRGEDSSVVLSPDGVRTGTNALLLRPPDALPFAFGPGSYEAHLRAARERCLSVTACERPNLAFDLDTGEDLARLEQREGSRP
jgi:2-phospho-L-lactate/phosphoenolpyruvate guanylyltransferase